MASLNRGFAAVEMIVIVVVIAVVGFIGWRMMGSSSEYRPMYKTQSDAYPESIQEDDSLTAGWPMDEDVMWDNSPEGWKAIYGIVPACPDPIEFIPPADLSKATSILYPGQERRGAFQGQGGNYKPHGGFRFDNSAYDEIEVSSPMDGYVYRGSRFLLEGEIQYGFDIISPCGIMVRVGHLRELSPMFQEIADKFPEAKELDSRTEKVVPMVKVQTGDLIATAVGLQSEGNTFFDWGVFDLRETNEASKDASYRAAHADATELTSYGVCWFDMLSKEDEALVRSLPAADPVNGTTSDYCN